MALKSKGEADGAKMFGETAPGVAGGAEAEGPRTLPKGTPPPPEEPGGGEPSEEEPVETLPPILVPIVAKVDSGTTIPPDVLDPNAPLPSVEPNRTVSRC